MTVPRSRSSFLRFAVALIAIAMLASCALALVGCAARPGKAESDAYAKLASGGKKLSVRAPVNDDERDVFLFAIDLWQSPTDVIEDEPLAKAKTKNSVATATVKLRDVNLSELVCKGFVFAMESEDGKSYTPVSSVYYITNSKVVHEKGDKIDESELAGDLKGIIGTPSELLALGARSTLVTVDLGDLICAGGGNGTRSFVFNGVTCHIDGDALDALDRRIKAYTESGISIYLELVQTKAYTEFGNRVSAIAIEGAHGAQGYALNMQSRDGVNMICAALDFLTERYSGGEHGRVDSLIIGRTVNNYSKFYADGLAFEMGVENYVRAVRMAYNLMLLHNPRGKVYISLGNNWTVAESGGVSAKELLTAFTGIAENGGDFFWQLCLEANASDASDSSIWDDTLAVGGNQFVSPANLETVTKILSTSAYKCNGYMRNLVLNRFAIGGGNEEAQAASYAYAYYTALDSNRVNALIYAKTTDSDNDAVRSGLYSAANGGLPEPKKLAEIFSAVDNEKIGDVAYVSGLVGEKWNKLYNDNSKLAVKRETFTASPVVRDSRKDHEDIADFCGGNSFGFVPISSDYAELRFADEWNKSALYASLDPESVSDMCGVITGELTAKSLKDAGYLTLTSMIEAVGGSVKLSVRLSGYDNSGKELVYTAESEVRAGEWTENYYDIKSFLKHIDSETLTLSVTAGAAASDTEVEGLWISSIGSEAPDKNEFPLWIIWVLVGVIVVGGLTAFVIWFRKNYTFVRE